MEFEDFENLMEILREYCKLNVISKYTNKWGITDHVSYIFQNGYEDTLTFKYMFDTKTIHIFHTNIGKWIDCTDIGIAYGDVDMWENIIGIELRVYGFKVMDINIWKRRCEN